MAIPSSEISGLGVAESFIPDGETLASMAYGYLSSDEESEAKKEKRKEELAAKWARARAKVLTLARLRSGMVSSEESNMRHQKQDRAEASVVAGASASTMAVGSETSARAVRLPDHVLQAVRTPRRSRSPFRKLCGDGIEVSSVRTPIDQLSCGNLNAYAGPIGGGPLQWAVSSTPSSEDVSDDACARTRSPSAAYGAGRASLSDAADSSQPHVRRPLSRSDLEATLQDGKSVGALSIWLH